MNGLDFMPSFRLFSFYLFVLSSSDVLSLVFSYNPIEEYLFSNKGRKGIGQDCRGGE